MTGATSLAVELGAKRLELLHEIVPTAKVIAALVNPLGPNAAPNVKDMRTAADALGVELAILNASSSSDFDTTFDSLTRQNVGGLVIGSDAFTNTQYERLAELSVRHRVPSIFQYREFVAAGGLMSYGGGNVTDMFRLAGLYAGRILKGENPADLSVQQSSKIELIINLKTAKALGLTAPLTLLGRADEVIE